MQHIALYAQYPSLDASCEKRSLASHTSRTVHVDHPKQLVFIVGAFEPTSTFDMIVNQAEAPSTQLPTRQKESIWQIEPFHVTSGPLK